MQHKCNKHGKFEGKRENAKCPKCRGEKIANSKRETKEDFIQKAKIVHGSKYTYRKVEDVLGKKVTITCRNHGDFEQDRGSHLTGSGCPKCGVETSSAKRMGRIKPLLEQRLTTEEFISKAKRIHGRKYDYTETIYVKANSLVTVICKAHGKFKLRANDHLAGKQGCAKCGKKEASKKLRKYTTETFIEESKTQHGAVYTYARCSYVNANTKVTVTCRIHGDYKIIPSAHVAGKGNCPKCSSTRYSRTALKWVEEYAKKHKLKGVQHAANGGEFQIPNTKFRVDGFHARSNTVFEFHGSCWHGDPNVFKPTDKCHPFDKSVTAGDLYKQTVARERALRKLGYNVVVMWESDYYLGNN